MPRPWGRAAGCVGGRSVGQGCWVRWGRCVRPDGVQQVTKVVESTAWLGLGPEVRLTSSMSRM